MTRWLYIVFLRARSLFRQGQVEKELSDELQFHLERLVEQKRAEGMPPEQARYAALHEMGGVEQIKEECRDMRRTNVIENLRQDLGYAARQLRNNPGFSAVIVLSLALGIGANSTIFSVINALLFRPLPYEHSERLVAIWATLPGNPNLWDPPPVAESIDWKTQNHVFDDIALTSFTEDSTASGIGEPQPIRVQYVTPDFFTLLGVKPILGRIFRAGEMQDRTLSVVISSPFWKSHFNSDPKVLGKTFNIWGAVATVVGVMPPGFAPFFGNRIDLWEPINPAGDMFKSRTDHWLMPVARLKAGVTLQQAQAEMDVIARRLEQAYPNSNQGVGKILRPLHQELFGWAGGALYPLLGAVGFVLLIACVNVANLLWSRTETRRKEYALRASLGANRRRLMQQLLAECGLLALLGGCLGIILSFGGIRIFLLLAGEFPIAGGINIDGRVLAFTLGVSLLTALLFGLGPAALASNPDLNSALRGGERRLTAGSRGLTRHVLAVSEVALAMVLLIGAGLMINTMLRLQRVDPGFDAHNLLTLEVTLPDGGKYAERLPGGNRFKASPRVTAFHLELLAKAAALPGVSSVGMVSGVPTHWSEWRSFSILGHPAPLPDKRPFTSYNEVSPGFFRTLRIPLKRGRYPDEHDAPGAPWVVVVNEAFAQRFFPNENPLGQQILMRYENYHVDEEHPRQIVGVVGDVKEFGLGENAPPFAYASYLQQPAVFPGGRIVTHLRGDLVIRTDSGLRGRLPDLLAGVKKAVAELDPDQPVTHIMTMEEVLTESIGDSRLYMQLMGIFAGMALLLALIGIYGVMSHFVAERTREIGVRVALGAQRADILRMVARLGVTLTSMGVAIGVGLALLSTRVIGRFLFGVKPTDPSTYAGVAAALAAIALLACYVPARRATKVDPMVVLRYE